MKLLIDMNLSPLWVEFLSRHGYPAAHWSKVGNAAAPDIEILSFAAANGYVVFTHDLDFGTLLAQRQSRTPSVIQIRTQDVLPASIGDAVLRALEAAQSHLEAGALVMIDTTRNRIRMLPI